MVALQLLFAAALAYAIGSLSPAYLLGRAVGGVDIRQHGRRDAGIRNAGIVLGIWPAAVAAALDLGKGVAAVLVAEALLAVPASLLFVPIAGVVIGCVFPVYSGFRGDRGLITCLGIYLFLVLRSVVAGDFSPVSLATMTGLAALFFVATRDWDVTGAFAGTFMLLQTPAELGLTWSAAGAVAIAGYVVAVCLAAVVRRRVFEPVAGREMKIWRLAARPFALLFIPIDLIWDRRVLLFIVGVVALVFILTDFLRLATKLQLRAVFRKGESGRFSSMTLFLVSVFLAFLLFPGEIPYIALVCLTFGDLFAKLIGIVYGSTKIYKSRTLEGSLGFLCGSIMVTYLLSAMLEISVVFVLVGSVVAAVTELFSEQIDDNFTVSLLSGGVLAALRWFIGA